MHPKTKVQAQNDSAKRFATKFLGDMQIDEQAGLVIATARHEWIEKYADRLEEERQQLNNELMHIVLTYAGKIQLIDDLLREAGRESERQLILKEWAEKGGGADEETETNTFRKENC